jgi:hypothetical protein
MKFARFVCCLVAVLITASCGTRETSEGTAAPKEVSLQVAIERTFKGAVPFDEYVDSLLFFLYAVHKIAPNKILLGQSTCVDDVINTKNPFADHDIKGPINFGGLAGLPFAGVTGFNAFAHHVPDSGAALLFIGPHIGYSQTEGWGKIQREGQLETSACCGALVGALHKLHTPGLILKKEPDDIDYQEQVIEQLALRHKDEILASREPLITFTKLIYKEAERRVHNTPLPGLKFRHLILIVGVIINTDHNYPDYIWVDHMTIYDVDKGKALQIMEE